MGQIREIYKSKIKNSKNIVLRKIQFNNESVFMLRIPSLSILTFSPHGNFLCALLNLFWGTFTKKSHSLILALIKLILVTILYLYKANKDFSISNRYSLLYNLTGIA